MKHIVQCSFGESSWYAGKRVAERHGTDDLIWLFADTKCEDEDTYAWGRAAVATVGGKLVEIADGRDIWEVFRDKRFIGNDRIDPCSKILKRDLCRKWVADNYAPEECILYVGISLFEKDRMEAIRRGWLPYRVESPLLDHPWPSPTEIRQEVLKDGLWVQRLYKMGFPHANCGGVCVRAGQGQWRRLLETMPSRYLEAEIKEQGLRDLIGKDVSILTDRRGGHRKPLTLRQFRERVQAEEDTAEVVATGASCSCMAGPSGGEE